MTGKEISPPEAWIGRRVFVMYPQPEHFIPSHESALHLGKEPGTLRGRLQSVGDRGITISIETPDGEVAGNSYFIPWTSVMLMQLDEQ